MRDSSPRMKSVMVGYIGMPSSTIAIKLGEGL
jgi:hypothetical protein